jgi:N6-L-threonylcarbamoyladenine synthase
VKILSIETSCDETAIALLDIQGPLEKPEITVLGNTLYSQAKLHEEFGGVFPALAKREHQKNLPILLKKTLTEARVDPLNPELDFIAVTTGPGLEPALWTGIVFAKELGEKWGKPVVPVNHMEGHIFSVLSTLTESAPLAFPALALLVSGGHTELVEIKDFGDYRVIGQTVDDAAGEAFDKVARMLNLPYPGGPRISALAKEAREEGVESSFALPRPMLHSGDLNFSFSGLKTAVLYKIRDLNRTDAQFTKEIAREFEEAVVEVLIAKTRQALTAASEDMRTLVIAGGVAANTYLCEQFETFTQEFPHLSLRLPTKTLATDNAIMIGIAAYVRVTKHPEFLETPSILEAKGNLSITSSPRA